MDKERIRELKKKAHHLEPVVRIGKNGLTEGVITQVRNALKKQGLIKVRFLRSFVEGHDRKEEASMLARATGSALVDVAGFVVVLYKSTTNRNVTQNTRKT